MVSTNVSLRQPAPSKKGRGWSIAAFVATMVSVAIGLVIGGAGVLYLGASVATGAPEIVLLSIAQLLHRVALIVVGPFALVSLVLAIVALARRGRGGPIGFAITSLVLSSLCILLLVAGLPLMQVDPCFALSCA